MISGLILVLHSIWWMSRLLFLLAGLKVWVIVSGFDRAQRVIDQSVVGFVSSYH